MVNLCARYERHTANTRLPFSRQVVPPPQKLCQRIVRIVGVKRKKLGPCN